MAMDALNKFSKTYKQDEILFSEYETGNSFYLIQSGKVKITKIVGETEKTLDILGPGDIFGEMAILEEAPRSASAIALSEVKTLHFNKENFEMLLQSNSAMAIKLLKLFSKRIYDARRKLMILSLEDDEAKVADVLLMLAEQKGYSPKEIKEFIEPMEIIITAQDIANWCGLKLDNVKKILSQFINMNRISMCGNSVVVKNINEISRYVSQKRKYPE